MTRRQLIAIVNQNCKFTNKEGVEYILKLLEKTIVDALIQGHTIKLNGFLKLGVKQTSSRKGKFKGKKWKSKSKLVAYAKVSPVVSTKIQEHKETDWLDTFLSYPEEIQHEFYAEVKRQIDAQKE
ncbi:HU family DNA-binding protein [Sulfurimonas sp. SAG-AH-194-I05]|nr:HU family DNA-binding protein [Sulfurimonas sp. SAG-AH-194-I05]MDF1875930.1 HU family DNA-binding protein [Sulfurimonas sp. SAG-AH-194-I05]